MNALSIGQVAKQAGVGVETVRYYERRGLLEEPDRKASGYRQYDDQAVAILKFIRRAKELGFTLREIKSLLALRLDSSASPSDVRNVAKAKVADIEGRIADLQRMRDALQKLVQKCKGHGRVSGCPILAAMQDSSSCEDKSM